MGLITGLAASGLGEGKPVKLLGINFEAPTEQTLVWLVVFVLFVFILKATLAVVLGSSIAKFLAKVELSKAMEITRYLFSGSLQALQRFSQAEIQWAAIGSAGFAFSGILTSLSTLITEGVLLVFVMTAFFFIDPMATFFVCIYFGLIVVAIQFVIGHRLKKAGKESQDGHVLSMSNINDLADAYKEIVTFRKEAYFFEKFEQSRWQVARTYGTINFIAGMPRYVVETALMFGVVVFVGWQFLTGQLTSGMVTVGVFLTGGVRIMASLLPLQGAVSGITNQSGQGQLAQEILTEISVHNSSPSVQPEGISSCSSDLSTEKKGLSVDINNLEYSYGGADFPVLKVLILSLCQGKM